MASEVDPSNDAGLGTAEPAVADKDAADQTDREQPVEQPTVVSVAETAQEVPVQDRARVRTPTRGDETEKMPPPNSVAEEGDKVPTPPPAEEERAPTTVPAEASTPEGSPSHGKGPMMPVTMAGGSGEAAEAQVASDDEVEEIQGRPRDGRQHVYVWHQRGDPWAGHEELAETEEATRVERAAKRLVDEVKVSGHVFCQKVHILLLVHCAICIILAGRNENGEVPKKVLRPN